MPARMPVMAFAAFARTNRTFDFQSGYGSIVLGFANQIWITLIMIVFVR